MGPRSGSACEYASWGSGDGAPDPHPAAGAKPVAAADGSIDDDCCDPTDGAICVAPPDGSIDAACCAPTDGAICVAPPDGSIDGASCVATCACGPTGASGKATPPTVFAAPRASAKPTSLGNATGTDESS